MLSIDTESDMAQVANGIPVSGSIQSTANELKISWP